MAAEMRLKKVLVSDEVDDCCLEILRSAGLEVTKKIDLTKDQLLKEIANGYDGLIVRSATKVTSEVMEAGSQLKIVGRAGTGVDNIDVNAAKSKGIVVINTPDGNTVSAAELTCALILASSRFVGAGAEAVRSGNWKKRKDLMGVELYGKTLALVGLGRIGQNVARRMQAFGMKTIGFDPILGADISRQFDIEWMPLDEIWPQADFITLHTPLTKGTHHLINTEVLKKCKKGVRIINCARGGIVDEDALLAALQCGQCAAAGLDVFEQEPPSCTDLINHPCLIATPHLGASTEDAQIRVAVDVAREFVSFAKGNIPKGVVC